MNKCEGYFEQEVLNPCGYGTKIIGHCNGPKTVSRAGFMGYPDTYHCRCCGTELVKVSEILNLLIKEKIDKISKNNEKEEGNKIGY